MKVSKERLLVAAMVIAPFTLLRFGFMGIAEIIVLLVFLSQATKPLKKSLFRGFMLTRFWILYLVLAGIGLAINKLLLSNPTGTTRQELFDAAAYVFILITCYSVERLATHSAFDARRFGRDVFVCSVLVFSIFYVVSFFTSSLFGMPIKYYNYFVPWAENLHQISMTLVPLPFLGIAVAANTRGGLKKILLVGMSVLAGVMAVSTGSSKALLAMFVGTFVLAYSYALRRIGRSKLIHVNLAFGIVALLVLASTDWVRVGDALFEENDVGGVRNYLYSHALDLGLHTLLFGRGPGAHIEFNGAYMDAHQTFLTALLQAGILGVSAFVVLLVRMGRRVLYDPPLLAALSGLVIYAAGGDILRRLPAWVMFFIILYYPRGAADARSTGLSPRQGSRPALESLHR